MEKINALFVGFLKGMNTVFGYKLIGPIKVIDVLMIFNVVFGVYRGWDDPDNNAIVGWLLAGWFYVCVSGLEAVDALNKQAVSDATEALQMASAAMEMQQERIQNQQAEIEALKNLGN